MSETTALQQELACKIRAKRREIWEWYCKHSQAAPPPFYCSIDLRDAGFKIVPVDSNLFPAGFNNICPEDRRASPKPLLRQIQKISAQYGIPEPKRVAILPETHTTNVYYIENLYYLREIFRNAGFDTEIAWLGDGTQELKSETHKLLKAYPFTLEDGRMRMQRPERVTFEPDLVVLNNDFSGGYPEILEQVRQPIVPSFKLGWHSRKKSEHFEYYNLFARQFAELIGVDPWILTVDTTEVAEVHFNEEQGLDRVEAAVRDCLARTADAYSKYGVQRKPFAFIKNNAGTYGMGIHVVHDPSEVHQLNRRTKNKMSVGKNRSVIESVAVQEGVPTATLVDRLPSEPVIYLVGSELLGGFLRTNTERGDEDNLNSQGMVFRKLCMSDLKDPQVDCDEEEEPILELVYGTIARISALATGLELKRHV